MAKPKKSDSKKKATIKVKDLGAKKNPKGGEISLPYSKIKWEY